MNSSDPCSDSPTACTVRSAGLTAWYGVTVVNLSFRPSTVVPARTVTAFWCIDAWMVRTRALPRGVFNRSLNTCSRRPDAGPMPATVYASPAATLTVVDRTGLDVAAAPGMRMATVYSPVGTRLYPDTVP